MDKMKAVRDGILSYLKQSSPDGITAVEIDGNYFAAADVAIKKAESNPDVFRIAVVQHNQKISLT